MTGDICDALLDTSGSAALLAELERDQFFTTSTDGGVTYHYHQVLQTHLEVVLTDELGSRNARTLYSRSGELLEQAGYPSAAVPSPRPGRGLGSVARLLKMGTAPVAGDDALWGSLALPGTPTDDPGLVLAGARRLLRSGQIVEAVAAFRQAEDLLDDREFRRRCSAERSAAALWLPQPPAVEPTPTDPRALRLAAELRSLTREVRTPNRLTLPLARGWRCGSAATRSRRRGCCGERRPGSPKRPPGNRWRCASPRS